MGPAPWPREPTLGSGDKDRASCCLKLGLSSWLGSWCLGFSCPESGGGAAKLSQTGSWRTEQRREGGRKGGGAHASEPHGGSL